jgi:hypothetical protein
MVNMTNVMKFQAPFERLKLYNASPDIVLRKAIIMQAVIDATNISDSKEAKKLEIEAKAWIFGNDEIFKTICIEAGIEASFIVKITKEIIKIHRNQSASRRNMNKNDCKDKTQDSALYERAKMMCF